MSCGETGFEESVGTHLAGLTLGVILLLLLSGSFGIRLGLVLLLDLLLLRIGQLIRNLLDVLGRHCRNEGKLRIAKDCALALSMAMRAPALWGIFRVS